MGSPFQLIHTTFNGGEVSPLIDARVDVDGHMRNCRLLENFIVRPHGAIVRRPGTARMGKAYQNKKARLEGFSRSTNDNYILEFVDGFITIWKPRFGVGRLQVTSPTKGLPNNGDYSFTAWVTATTYFQGQTVYNSTGNVMYICIQQHSSGSTTKPGEGASWGEYWQAFSYKEGDVVTKYNDVIFLPELFRCLRTHSIYTPLEVQDSDNWMLLPSESLGSAPYVVIPSPYSESELFEIQMVQLNDVMFLAHPNHNPKRLSRYDVDDWRLEEMPFQFAPGLDLNENRLSVQIQYDGVPDWAEAWVADTDYGDGDHVHRASTGVIYRCKLGHTSSAAGTGGNEPGNGASWMTYWDVVASGYTVGARVVAIDPISGVNPYAGSIFTCHTAHAPNTSNSEPGIGSNWPNYWNLGTSRVKIPAWVKNTDYTQGMKVRVGTVIYQCIRTHKSVAAVIQSGGRASKVVTPGNRPGGSGVWVRYWRISTTDTDLSGLNFALYSTDPLFEITDVGTIWQLHLGTGGIIDELALPTVIGSTTMENNPLFIQGGFTVNSSWKTDEAMLGTITLEESLDNATWNVIRQWSQSNKSDGNISYSGEAPAVGAWYRLSSRSTATTPATKVKIEATSSVYILPFKVTAFESSTKVLGHVIMPADQLPPGDVIGVSSSLFRRPAFSEVNGYPRAVAFHDSRLWWGGTRNHPTRMWASQIEDFYIYLTGALDTDGLDLTLAAVESNAIQWMVSFNRTLVIGTSGDEWTLDSGETDETLKPTNLRARRRTRYGSIGQPPQLTGEALLWVGRNGRSIYEFSYDFQRDSYRAPDMTILADHILGDGVKQLAFQSSIDPILWVVLNNGQLAGLSYNRDQQIVAWHRHITGPRRPHIAPLPEGVPPNDGDIKSTFSSVATAYGEHCDEVWFNVLRWNIYTEEYDSFIERFDPKLMAWAMGAPDAVLKADFEHTDSRWKYLDSHYDANSSDDFTPYDKLAYSRPDGATSEPGVTYEVGDDGKLPFPDAFDACWGYPFLSQVVLPKIEMMTRTGTIQGGFFNYNRMIAKVWKSKTAFWTITRDDMPEAAGALSESTSSSLLQEIPLRPYIRSVGPNLPLFDFDTDFQETVTGQLEEINLNGDWCHNPQLIVSSMAIQPFSLLSLVLKLEISGD